MFLVWPVAVASFLSSSRHTQSREKKWEGRNVIIETGRKTKQNTWCIKGESMDMEQPVGAVLLSKSVVTVKFREKMNSVQVKFVETLRQE